MAKLTADALRTMYLDFFASKGHAVISGASVIPENDPTVLFTTAGMHPLVPYLLGEPHPAGRRLTDVQKCVRTGDIDAVGAKNTETKVFDLVDAMITGKTDKALEIYRNMLAVNESPIMVLSLISRQFRIMLKCKSLSQSGYSENDMAAKIGVNPYAAKIALRQSRSFGYEIIEQMLNRCIETDYSIKSGALNAETGVELVIAMGIE